MKGDEIVEVARKEIGYSESPDNSNLTKYGKWFGFDGQPWCAMFVSWCYSQAGYPLENIGFSKGYAGCQTAVDHFSETGQLSDSPVAGDLVFFDWTDDGHYDHTGIFVRDIDDDHFESVEGNTSLANQSNGGIVMLRTRHYRSALFAHPKVLEEYVV